MSRFLKYDLIFSIIILFFVSLPTYADTTTLVEDFSLGSEGEGNGQFLSPASIAIGQDEMIYVTDNERNVVQAFTCNGTFITIWDGCPGDEFLGLSGIAVSPGGDIYTIDPRKAQVQQFTSSGSFIRAFGEEGSGPGEFYDPRGIAVNSSGYVFVADRLNSRIEIFTSEGEYYDSWDSVTGMPSDFIEPLSIAIGQNDNVCVGLRFDRIYCFSPEKTLLQSWDIPNRDSLSVGPDGYLYAVQKGSSPEVSATVYQCAMDGSARPLMTGSNSGFAGISVDQENAIFCTDAYDYQVIRFLHGTKTPALSLPHIVWSDPLTAESTRDVGNGICLSGDGGTAETGITGNVMYSRDMLVVKRDKDGIIQWMNTYGGERTDNGNAIIETYNGNYTVIGTTGSDLPGSHSNGDYWVVMLDEKGTVLWERCFGGSSFDQGMDILKTDKGTFLLMGYTSSDDGDVSGNHGESDIWVVEIDAEGSIIWQKCYGGSESDYGYSIIESNTGGYLLTGYTSSDDGDVSGNHGESDIWVVEIDAEGSIIWQKCYGGTGDDAATSIIQTDDGDYLITGYTLSDDGDIIGNHGATDIVGIMINSVGDILWQKCYGGTDNDLGYDLMAYNGEYIFVGETQSSDGDITGYHGHGDAWVIKTDASGNLVWAQCFGGSSEDTANSGTSRGDGTYVITGETYSIDGDISDPDVDDDLWTFMIDELKAGFNANPVSGTAPLTVPFTGWISSGMEADSWSWYFGDGGISHEQNPVHQYTAPGTYTVKMEVAGPGFDNTVEKPGYITII